MSGARLDPGLNRAPESLCHVHVMGVCGTGMAALAGMLAARGLKVSGSDENVYPPMSDFLASTKVEVRIGYGRKNLEPRPDLVVVGNVIRAVNPEAVALAELGIPYLSMPQALAHFFLQGRRPLVVAGTHGKTTTSSLLAATLHRLGAEPGCMIGGMVEAFGRNFNLGGGESFVVEGDEYDTAFFDKGSKFLHYRPWGAILTSIEFDHADIFVSLEQIVESFRRFVALIPEDGILLAWGDDPRVMEVARQARCTVRSYGFDPACDWRLLDCEAQGTRTRFRLRGPGGREGDFDLPMPGRYNALNAAAVIGLLDWLGQDLDRVRQGLSMFEGVRRRQQIRGEERGVMVIDDFAHHPTAVRETLAGLRCAWPERRLVAVFEPRTNSSRRAVFQRQYVESFDSADLVLVREALPLAGLAVEERFSSARLVADLAGRGREAHCFADTDGIIDFVDANARSGDVLAVLSNGGFDDIHRRLLHLLAAA